MGFALFLPGWDTEVEAIGTRRRESRIYELGSGRYLAPLAATRGMKISAVVLCKSGTNRRVAPGP